MQFIKEKLSDNHKMGQHRKRSWFSRLYTALRGQPCRQKKLFNTKLEHKIFVNSLSYDLSCLIIFCRNLTAFIWRHLQANPFSQRLMTFNHIASVLQDISQRTTAVTLAVYLNKPWAPTIMLHFILPKVHWYTSEFTDPVIQAGEGVITRKKGSRLHEVAVAARTWIADRRN